MSSASWGSEDQRPTDVDEVFTTTVLMSTRSVNPRASRVASTTPPHDQIRVSGTTTAPRDAVFRRLDVDLLVAKKQITQTDVIVTGTFFTGSIVSSGPISGSQLNISGPATVGSLTANTIAGNNLIANTVTINTALINNASMNNATIDNATITTLDVVTSLTAGNGTFEGPLYLQGNPPATDNDLLLARNSSGAVTQTTVPVGLLTGATSGNVPNTLVLRDILGNFATNKITANGLDVVGTTTFRSPVYNLFANVSPNNVLYVQKGQIRAPNQFNSVKAAVDSITGSSATNLYVVLVSPGVYGEDPITLKPYMCVRGDSEGTAIIQANNPNADLITAVDQTYMRNLTLRGASGAGAAAVFVDGGTVTMQVINFDACDIFLKLRATMQPTNVSVVTAGVLETSVFSSFADVQSNMGLPVYPCVLAVTGVVWIPSSPMAAGLTAFNVAGPGAFLTATTLGFGNPLIPPTPSSGTKFLQLSNGGTVQLASSLFQGFDVGVSVPAGLIGPSLNLLSVVAGNNNTDVSVQDQQTSGSLTGEFTSSKLVIDPAVTGLSLSIMEPTSGGVTMLGPLFTGRYINAITNISPLINDGASLGTIGSSLLYTTTSSLIVTVSAGSGYLMNTPVIMTPTPVDNLALVTWLTTTTLLLPNKDNFLYVDNTGRLQASLSQPSSLMSIPLGKVRTGTSGALFIEQINQDAGHTATQLTGSFIEALGPIYVTGSTVSKNGDDGLTVTAGQYVYGTHTFAPVGASSLSWQAYLGAGANEFLTTQTAIDWQHFDNGGALDLIPTGSYAKHLLYVIGGVDTMSGATDEQYALVYSQTFFTTEQAAVSGPVPTPPAKWSGNIVQIASIVVQNNSGTPSAHIQQILDQRPRIGFVPSSVAGVTVHGNLLGLSADDHPQYLLVSGSRAMSGSLNMGTNQITNAGNINGVTIQSHASRHLPGSVLQDPLPMGVPVTIGTANNLSQSGGVVNNFAYSDHVHAHGAQTDSTLHALATTSAAGFMSAADKQALTNATPSNTPSTLVERDASGNFAAGVITAGLIGNVTGNIAASAGTAAAPSITFSGDTATGLFLPGVSEIGMAVSGTQSLTLDLSGNVALGMSASTPAISRAIALGYLATTTQTGAIVLGRVNPEVKVGIGTVAPFAQLTVAGSLKLAGKVGTVSSASCIFVQGRYAYVMRTGASSILQIIDVSNPSNPTLEGSVSGLPLGPVAIYVQGGYAYVMNAGGGSMSIIDVRNPNNPVVVATVATGAGSQSVYVQGRYAYVVNAGVFALQVFEVSNPALPVLVGSRALVGFNSPLWVTVQDNYAYVSQGTSNVLQIVDITNPTNPQLAGNIGLGSAPKGIAVQGRYAYVVLTTSPGKLQIVDISNPNSPTLAGFVSTGGNGPQLVSVQGRYAYVLNNSSATLQAIDISNPNSPFLVPGGNISTGAASATAFFVQGRYAYVLNGAAVTLQVIDLGGAYLQQLEAGGIETSTLSARSNATICNDLIVLGGETIGKNLNVAGFITANNNTTGTSSLNSPLRLVNIPQATTTALYIDTSGYVTKDASSRRFKEHITPLSTEHDLLYTLTPVKFDFKSDFSGRKNMYGFIAEDIADVYPSLVNYDAGGVPHDYVASALHALEIKALQQQRKQIENLLKTIVILQKQVNTLSARTLR